MADTRSERDSFGEMQIPAEALWGPQTQRAVENFPIGDHRMPPPLLHAFGLQKAACAVANMAVGGLDRAVGEAIVRAAGEVAAGILDAHFPLVVWQSGSGTQTNMNVNEVIAHRAMQLAQGQLAPGTRIHPNDDVNRSQSTNDSFPTATHIALGRQAMDRLLPALDALAGALEGKAALWPDLVKTGRTHMQDATPITVGQEMSGWAAQVRQSAARVRAALEEIWPLAQGGTAVGTGVNAPPGFRGAFMAEIARLTGLPFRAADNRYAALAAHDGVVAFTGALNATACALTKIANDVRLLGSGPRCGIGELVLPANEPGSSIMPGKVNPTQAESLTMVCARVIGNHVTATIGGMNGHLELNVYKPLLALVTLESLTLLADGADSFRLRCIDGLEPDARRIAETMDRSLMLVTALAPRIGYDKATAIAKKAHADGATLRDAALALGHVSGEDFDRWVDARAMARNPEEGS
ncbi:class II fumarate hydratase [Novispirillum sp. DQ9]|uniref:class II fumarate hydratase n=1 Tax=Novispirillum sp. DQ9 TaxID=3398612 RepID=UPI003C7C19C6